MSKYWGYHCVTCNISGESSKNHADVWLREVAEIAYPLIRPLEAAYAASTNDWGLDITIWGISEWVDFLAAHDGHEIELQSEYGDTKPLTIPAAPQ